MFSLPKLLVIALVFGAIYYFFFRKPKTVEKSKKNPKKPKHDQIEDTMIACPSCGTFVSTDDAFIKNGQYFCSKACMDK
jgi:uncharacterized protein